MCNMCLAHPKLKGESFCSLCAETHIIPFVAFTHGPGIKVGNWRESDAKNKAKGEVRIAAIRAKYRR